MIGCSLTSLENYIIIPFLLFFAMERWLKKNNRYRDKESYIIYTKITILTNQKNLKICYAKNDNKIIQKKKNKIFDNNKILKYKKYI